MPKLIYHISYTSLFVRYPKGLPVGSRMSSRSYEIDQVENPLNKTENISVAVNRRLAQIDVEGEQRLHYTHSHTHTVVVFRDRVTDDSDSSKRTAGLCCAWESPFQRHRPSPHNMEWWESNLKLSWEWPSSTGISDKVQREKDSKKCCYNALCLVILLTKWVTSGGERGG